MTRAEMVQWLLGQSDAARVEGLDAASVRLARAASEIERLGSIADAAVAYVDAESEHFEVLPACDGRRVFRELARVVAERRVR